MSRIDTLLEAFDDTLDDGSFTRGERKALKMLLKDAELDPIKQGALRAKVFDLAREHLGEMSAPRVIDWLETANKLLLTGAPATPDPRVYFSPGEDALDAIIATVKSARQILRICVFTITDDRIAKAILERHRSGVDVRIVTDNDKAFDKGSDIHKFSDAGIDVRVDTTVNHMHHKFALIDNHTVINGSYNWTRSAASCNNENVVVEECPVLVREFRKEFDRLWEVTEPF